MILCEDSSARKVSRNELELDLKGSYKKKYILLQVNLSEAPRKEDNFSCFLDDWVDNINKVVQFLK